MHINTDNVHRHLATLDAPLPKPKTLAELWAVFIANQRSEMNYRAEHYRDGKGTVSQPWFTKQAEQHEFKMQNQ